MKSLKSVALRLIILFGIVSLFADVAYEGARSIAGPFLSLLGASGTAVGIIAGLGQLFGYCMRVVSGYVSDKTQSYWTLTWIGYVINLAAVPLLALAHSWQLAGFLYILERFGRAIRIPARDTMLSYAANQVGRGFGFGLHEFLDQLGAIAGPLLITALLYKDKSYPFCFTLLGIPALLSLGTLLIARLKFPRPQRLERDQPHTIPSQKGFSTPYWQYVLAVGFVAAGFTDFSLIAFHFHKTTSIPMLWIPFLYALAMAVAGLSSLLMGYIYDAKGVSLLAWVTGLSALFAPLVFLGHLSAAIIGMTLWGIGLGSQESIMRAVVAELIPMRKRGSAYGMLNLFFGLFWAVGSSIMGLLYDVSILYLVIFSMLLQFISIPFFLRLRLR